jgi:CRP-like cAMP-binding protein
MKRLGSLGRTYSDGELIFRQGERADVLYVVQEGRVEFVRRVDNKEIPLAVCGQGQIIGEWALCEPNEHPTDVRAAGPVRLVTLHRKNILRRMQEDPSFALRIIETLSSRFCDLTHELVRLHTQADRT